MQERKCTSHENQLNGKIQADKVEEWKLISGTCMTSCAHLRAKKLSKFPKAKETVHDMKQAS